MDLGSGSGLGEGGALGGGAAGIRMSGCYPNIFRLSFINVEVAWEQFRPC